MHTKRHFEKIKKIDKKKQKIKVIRKKDKIKFIKKGGLFFLVFLSFIFLAAIVYIANLVAVYSFQLPSNETPFKRVLPESSIIYDANGNTLYNIYKTDNRIFIPLKDIPSKIKMAMIAAEDINFYEEDGINVLAILRSGLNNIFNYSDDSKLQGASTITQQLVKYTTLGNSRTFERKIKELILTMQITQKYSKDQILEAYLNDVPFGGSNYGIHIASLAYFNKSLKDLDLSECAFLAGLPQSPSTYSPLFAQNKELALKLSMERRNYVLDQMLKYKNITHVTKQEVADAKSEVLTFNSPVSIKYPQFVFYIKDLVSKIYSKDVIDTEGLKIYTTLNSQIQDIGQEEVTKGVNRFVSQGLNTHDGSLVAIDASNGNLLAMVGSANYEDTTRQGSGNSNMTTFPISPGSSIKPFVYLTAFQNGMNADTIVHDKKTTFTGNFAPYTPTDWDGKDEGDISISKALLESRNIPAVEVATQVGVYKIYENLLKAGYSDLDPNCSYIPSIAIGGCEMSLLEHTGGFQVFAEQGYRYPIRSILKIEDKYGKVIFDNTKTSSIKSINNKEISQVNDILKNYHTLGPVKSAGYNVAGKTGTAEGYKNNLFMGYSSSLVTGVWVGNADQSYTTDHTFGENTASPIWNAFMLRVLPMFPNKVNTF